MDLPPVQYAKTPDGFDIAYSVTGEGQPLVFLPPFLSSIQMVWSFYPEWMQGLAKRFRLVQYDSRGEGLSSRNLPPDLTLADYDSDLETVIQRLQLSHLILYGNAARGHTAIRYAVEHPERVDALILNICSAVAEEGLAYWQAVPEEDWDFFLLDVTPKWMSSEERRKRADDYRRCVNKQDWALQPCVGITTDVAELLPRLRVPTLVLHPRETFYVQPEESMALASKIPGAQFKLIDGDYFYSEAAESGLVAIDAFLTEAPHTQSNRVAATFESADRLSPREAEVLRLVASGRSNQQIADDLVISLNTVERHVSNIFDKIGAVNRTEAASFAHLRHLV